MACLPRSELLQRSPSRRWARLSPLSQCCPAPGLAAIGPAHRASRGAINGQSDDMPTIPKLDPGIAPHLGLDDGAPIERSMSDHFSMKKILVIPTNLAGQSRDQAFAGREASFPTYSMPTSRTPWRTRSPRRSAGIGPRARLFPAQGGGSPSGFSVRRTGVQLSCRQGCQCE